MPIFLATPCAIAKTCYVDLCCILTPTNNLYWRETLFLSHNSAQLYTVEFGSGSRAILAHSGWTGSWELWSGPFTYLSKTWRTVAYDHRGSGATVAPIESISIETMVNDLFAVMDNMEIDKCVLAAESAGGIVAVTAVLEGPQHFEGLVLVDALLHKENDGSDAAFIHGLKTDFNKTIRIYRIANSGQPAPHPGRHRSCPNHDKTLRNCPGN